MFRVVSPTCESSNGIGLFNSLKESNRVLDSLSSRSLVGCDILNMGFISFKSRGNYVSLNVAYAAAVFNLKNEFKMHRISCVAGIPMGEMALSSEQKVYEVVLKQAALLKRHLASCKNMEVKTGIGSLKLLNEAYNRCEQVCSEYSKTFYLGTKLMTPERQKAIWAIYVWCRRTDDLVDGPNALGITPATLDRWEARLEDIFKGEPLDMIDAALADTVHMFPVDIQPFRDLIGGMRMDLEKSRYKNFDELYLYCYYVAGTVGLMTVPVMGIAPESKATTESVYNGAVALGVANQLTNILRDVGEDARSGRVYLPQDELAQSGLSDDDIFAMKVTDKWRNFMRKQIKRARKFYAHAERAVAELSPASRWPMWASLLMYKQILDEIEANDMTITTSQRRLVWPSQRRSWHCQWHMPRLCSRPRQEPHLLVFCNGTRVAARVVCTTVDYSFTLS